MDLVLGAPFLARLGDPGPFMALPAGELEAALRALTDTGRGAWPGVALADATFVQHLAAVVAVEGDAREALAGLRAAELYLACACGEGEPRALALFEARVLVPARAGLAGFEKRGTVVVDALQAVRRKLFVAEPGERKKILDYDGRGTLEGWVKVALVRTALNLSRARNAVSLDEEDADQPISALADPEIDFMKTEHREAFREAVSETLGSYPADDRNMMRFYFVECLNIGAIGQIFGLHRATVARRINQLRERLVIDVRTRLAERLKLSGSEVQSFLRIIQSQLDVSLLGVLRDRPP